MVDKPDIVKRLMEEEKLGKLEGSSQGSHEELEFPEELPKNTSDESTEFFSENFKNEGLGIELTQHGSLSGDLSVDEKELLFQSTNDLMLYLDKHGRITKINKAGIAFSGFSEDEIIGQFFWKMPGVLSKHNLPQYLKVFKNTLKGKPTGSFLSELHEKSGKKHIMDFSTYLIKENEKLASILVVAKDVTEQRETEDKYRLITESSLDTIFALTKSGKCTYISPSSKELFGFEPSEMIGTSFVKYVPKGELSKYWKALKNVILHKKIPGFETYIKHRNGNLIPVEINGQIIERNGKLVAQGTMRDITKRKKAEEEVKEVKNHFQTLFNIMVDPVIILNPKGKFLEVTDRVKEITGFEKDDLIGKNFLKTKLLTRKSKAICIENLLKRMSGIKVAPYEVEVLTKDGRKLPFEINAERIDYKGKTADMIALRDISDRKQMEHELKDSEERSRLMFENAPDGYYLHDLKGTFIDGNSTAEKLTGYKREELIGKSFTKLKLLPKGQLSKAVGGLAKSAFGKNTGPDEFTLNRKDGSQVSVEINTCPVKIKGKTMVLGIVRDITERKQAEEELKEVGERLELAMDAGEHGFWDWNLDTDDVYFSPRYYTMLGYEPGELPMRLETWANLMHPEDRKDIVPRVQKHVENAESYEVKFRLKCKDGSWKWISGRGKTFEKDENGIPHRAVGVHVDVTERKKAEEKIKQQNKINIMRAEIWKLAVQPISEDELIQQLVDKIGPFFNLEHANFLRIYPEKKKAIVDIQWRKEDSKSGIGEEFPLWILKRYFGKPCKVISQGNIPSIAKPIITPFFKKFGVKSTILIPYGTINNPQGYITAAGRKADKEWSKDEIDIFSEAVKIISLKSEEIKAEKELKESEEKYRTFIDTASDLMNIADKDGKFTDVNEAMARTLGYAKEKMIGMHITQIFTKESLENDFKPNWEKLNKEGKISIETAFVAKDGKEIYGELKAVAIYDRDGKCAGSRVVFHNLTERKQMEILLRENEEKFRTISASAQDGIIMMNNDENVTYWNESAERMFGYKYDEIIGKNLHMVLAPQTFHEAHKKGFSKFKDTGKGAAIGKTLELSALKKDGTEFPIALSMSSVKIKGKWNAIGIVRDITERKQTEEELKEAHEMLQAVNSNLERKVEERTIEVEKLLKQKDEFVNQLGHDLKNPLGPLINLLPVLEKDETDSERKEIFEVLNRNTRHMENLVVKTIQLARLNAPSTKLNLEDVDLFSEADDTIKRNRSLFEENNMEIDNKISDKIIIKADKLKLTELFDNLINNAVKYTKGSGTITIDAEQDKDFVTVSVKDPGIGMNEEQLSHIFDEFYKADWSRHDFDSSGLGLPICKRIVEKHGGKIWAESKGEGKGTTMFFTLPMSSEKAVKVESIDINI